MTPTLELPRFEPLLDTEKAAALLDIHPKTLQSWRELEWCRAIELGISGASVLLNWTRGYDRDKLETATRAVKGGTHLVYAHAISKRKSSSEKERKRSKGMGV